MRIRRTWSLLGAILLGISALAGPGIHQALVLSPEGFTSLELVLFWNGEPVSASLSGRWEDTGFKYGEVGSSLRFETFGLSTKLRVETTGIWEASLGGEFSLPPLSLVGALSFGITGLTGGSLGTLLAWDVLSLQARVTWEECFRSDIAAYLTLEPLSLDAGISLSQGRVSWVQGGVGLVGDLGTVGFRASFYPPTQELLLSTEFDLRSEHLSFGFAAVWDPFPEERVHPAAVSSGESSSGGILRYLHELRLEASIVTPPGEATETSQERPLALISAPKRSAFVVGEEILFSGRGSRSPAGLRVEFLWDFGDGARARGIEVRHSYVAPGAYRVTLVVRDNRGHFVQTDRVLRILPPQPVADFTWDPSEPTVLDDVRFIDLSVGEIVSWHWDFGDGSASSEREPIHRYSQKDAFQVTLTVIDRYGNEATATKNLTVVNLPPLAEPGGPYEGMVYQEIIFSATDSHDPDGEIVKYIWDLGDGTLAEGETVIHAYHKPGTFQVCLTVVDDNGAEGEACTTAEIIYYPQVEGKP